MKKLHKAGTTILLALAPACALGLTTGIIVSNIKPVEPEPEPESWEVVATNPGKILTGYNCNGGYGKETIITYDIPDPTKYTIDFSSLCVTYNDETSGETKYLQIGEKGAEGTEVFVNDEKNGFTITADASKHKKINFVLCTNEVLKTDVTAEEFANLYAKALANFQAKYLPQESKRFESAEFFAKEYKSVGVHKYCLDTFPLTWNFASNICYLGAPQCGVEFGNIIEEVEVTEYSEKKLVHPGAGNTLANIQAYISQCETKYGVNAKYFEGVKTIRYCIESDTTRIEIGYDKSDGVVSYLSQYIKDSSENDEGIKLNNFCIPVIWHSN